MSHLDHIVKYKANLIKAGITCPYKQIDIVKTAYIRALCSLMFKKNIKREEIVYTCQSILGMWNEITPVDGTYVVEMVKAFSRNLYSSLENMDKCRSIVINPVNEEKIKEDNPDVDYYDIPGYSDLINCLLAEATEYYHINFND